MLYVSTEELERIEREAKEYANSIKITHEIDTSKTKIGIISYGLGFIPALILSMFFAIAVLASIYIILSN